MFDLTRDVRLSPSSLVRHVNENWFDSPFLFPPFRREISFPSITLWVHFTFVLVENLLHLLQNILLVSQLVSGRTQKLTPFLILILHSRLLKASSSSSIDIRNVLHQWMRCLASFSVYTGRIVFVSRWLTHFSLSSTFLYSFFCPPADRDFWCFRSNTRLRLMLGPEKYRAESRLPVPMVVAREASM